MQHIIALNPHRLRDRPVARLRPQILDQTPTFRPLHYILSGFNRLACAFDLLLQGIDQRTVLFHLPH